ncbi:MAG: outer membrane beta-barrel protein [Ginsengibacter sp.]
MDKNLHDIEDLFRKGLEDNEEEPSQNAWEGIEKKLDKDNVVSIKKKYNFLKKVALLLLFLLAGLSIYVWKFKDKNPFKPNKSISGINKETRTKNDTFTEESGISNLQNSVDTLTGNKKSNARPFKESVTTKGIDSLSVNNTNNQKQVTKGDSKIIDNTILKSENISPKKTLNSVSAKNLSKTSTKKNKIKIDKPGESHLTHVSESDVSKSDATKFSIQKKSKLIKRNPDEVVETKTPKQIEYKRPTVVNASSIQFDNNLPEIENLNSENAGNIKSNSSDLFATKESLHNIELAKINPLIQIKKTIVRTPSIKSTNQPRFAITAFYSPDFAFHHFVNSDQGNSNNTNFDIPESESNASTLGALIDYRISKHWGLQSGITLAVSDFELEYEKPETLYAQPDNSGAIQYKLTSPLGDAYVKPSFSSNPNIGDSIFSKSTEYNLQYIGIPLAVKYNFNKGKFTLNVLGGITANFLTRGQLTTELEYGNDNETETTNKIYGLKPFYFSGLAGLGVDYNIYKTFSLSFSPTLRFPLSAINRNVQEQSYPKSISFVLGIKMKL